MAAATGTPHRDAPGGRLFWLTNAAGMALVAIGIAGLLRHQAQTVPANLVRFLVGGLLAHDAVFAPVVGLGSLVLVRVVPRRVRPALQGALLVSAAVVLVSVPVLTGRGRNPNNPSILPGDYGEGLLKVLAVVWAIALVAAVRGLRRPPTAVDPDPPPTFPSRPGW